MNGEEVAAGMAASTRSVASGMSTSTRGGRDEPATALAITRSVSEPVAAADNDDAVKTNTEVESTPMVPPVTPAVRRSSVQPESPQETAAARPSPAVAEPGAPTATTTAAAPSVSTASPTKSRPSAQAAESSSSINSYGGDANTPQKPGMFF